MADSGEPTDDEVRARLRDTLKDTDLATTTEKTLRKQLEQHYGCSLKPRKALFKEEIEAFLATCNEPADEAEPEEAPSTTKRRGGFATPQSLSEELRAFLGVDESESLSRGEVVKRIWVYIREHDLQDPSNRRKILADPKMETIFNFPLNMFSMNKQLSRHIKSTNNVVGKAGAAPKKAKKRKAPTTDDGDDAGGDDAAPKKKGGFQQPQKLSAELAELLGVETASRPEVTKRLWEYFKAHDLQDPEDKRTILVAKDEALHAIVGVEKFAGFSMMKHLKEHFLGAAEAE